MINASRTSISPLVVGVETCNTHGLSGRSGAIATGCGIGVPEEHFCFGIVLLRTVEHFFSRCLALHLIGAAPR